MMTREERCLECECLLPEWVCPTMPNLPLMWRRLGEKCKHVGGDRWVDCKVDQPRQRRKFVMPKPLQDRLDHCAACGIASCMLQRMSRCQRKARVGLPGMECPEGLWEQDNG